MHQFPLVRGEEEEEEEEGEGEREMEVGKGNEGGRGGWREELRKVYHKDKGNTERQMGYFRRTYATSQIP